MSGSSRSGNVACDLIGDEHALIDQGSRRKAREVERVTLGQAESIRFVLDALADHVELPLERRHLRSVSEPDP